MYDDKHTDKLTNYIRYWQADGESEKTSIRTSNSMAILTEQGCFTGGLCPYGYELVKSGRTNKKKQEVHDLAICDAEAYVVRLMFRLAREEGYGAQRIANHLHANGIKKPQWKELAPGINSRHFKKSDVHRYSEKWQNSFPSSGTSSDH